MDPTKVSIDGVSDITGALGEDNPENRIYHTPDGSTVKVKVREVVPTPFGMRVFHISASDCDASGKAKPADLGLRIAPLRTVTLHAGPGAPPLADWLDEQCRREAVLLTLAVVNEYADPGRAGVETWIPPSLASEVGDGVA